MCKTVAEEYHEFRVAAATLTPEQLTDFADIMETNGGATKPNPQEVEGAHPAGLWSIVPKVLKAFLPRG